MRWVFPTSERRWARSRGVHGHHVLLFFRIPCSISTFIKSIPKSYRTEGGIIWCRECGIKEWGYVGLNSKKLGKLVGGIRKHEATCKNRKALGNGRAPQPL